MEALLVLLATVLQAGEHHCQLCDVSGGLITGNKPPHARERPSQSQTCPCQEAQLPDGERGHADAHNSGDDGRCSNADRKDQALPLPARLPRLLLNKHSSTQSKCLLDARAFSLVLPHR